MEATKLKIRKKDRVMVIAGKDRGKTGEVLSVDPERRRVLVAKVNVVTKHRKRTQGGPGGIEKMEAPVHYSNVMLVCPKCDKPIRAKIVALANGDKVRVCGKCGENLV